MQIVLQRRSISAIQHGVISVHAGAEISADALPVCGAVCSDAAFMHESTLCNRNI
jgi:hypothetical protein